MIKNNNRISWYNLRSAILFAFLLALMVLTACGSDSGQSESGTKYTLTIETFGDGSTKPYPGTHTYNEGALVQVTATAPNGVTFGGWSGAVTSTDNPVTVTMTADLTLTASFSGDSVLSDACSSTCDDATPVPPTPLSNGGLGNVTMYSTATSEGGACNYGSTDITHYAAIYSSIEPGDRAGRWERGRACGRCAEVTVLTTQGLRSLVVRIVDECPDAYCGIDLGGVAPGELMIDGFGRYEGEWRFVSCEGQPGVSDGPPALEVFNGSNLWWSRVLVRNGPNAVDTIEWQTVDGRRSGSFAYADSPENTYVVPVDDVLQADASSFLVTVHYMDGNTAKVTLSSKALATPGIYPFN